MKRMTLIAAALAATSWMGATVATAAPAIVITEAPPAPMHEVAPSPRAGRVWVEGHYAWRHGKTDPVSTCKMGVDETAVVDFDLEVRGLERLRVCASSIMPRLVSSNTNAPMLMIGEKAADLVRGSPQRDAMAPKELHAVS